MRVVGQFVKAVVIVEGFAGFAKPDLIGRNHPQASLLQLDGCFMPGGGTEIFAMHQHHNWCIRLGCRVVQVGHCDWLVGGDEIKIPHRRWVFKALQLRSINRHICPSGQAGQQADPCE